ncbi:uncharacterized protein LOC119981854 [Tripterygium wilfordii]|uniref:uncharacterized protein LOC119981854 n=1 Tax=Tripterygium wilfordii TaxID=458696 RepID=UPI0018F7FE99|nr:uncharacterized protein LOC119981854 [Tripterygium wilfordii]
MLTELIMNQQSQADQSVGRQEVPPQNEEIQNNEKVRSSHSGRSKETTRRVNPDGTVGETEMPRYLVVPKLEKYEGLTDPCDHIQGFKSMMECRGANALIMCKIFPSTLFEPAGTCFNRLPRHSVTSFGDLSEKLALHFSVARKTAKTSLDLMNLDHEPRESLRSFLARFNRACLEIPYVQVEVAISALVRTIRDEAYKQGRVEGRSDKRKDDQSSRKTDQGPVPRYSSYTPLNNSLHNILLEVSNRDILKWPMKMRAPVEKHTSDKYCLFHRDHGHDTEECRHLKDEIEGLIRRGYLKQFTSDREEKRRITDGDDRDDDRRRQRRRDRSPRHQRGTTGTIGVIVGGLVAGGECSSARRAYSLINEVLVDNGSAVDILFYHAFKEMKISEDKLKNF